MHSSCLGSPRPAIPGLRKLLSLIAPLAIFFALAAPARAVSTTIVISQVYGGGGNSGATLKNDFIELFNRGATTVSVTGWSVQYTSSAGTTWQVTNLSGSIPPGKYYLVQDAAGAGGTTNLPTPDATGGIAMSATGAKVALVNSTAALSGSGCPFAASVVDFVGYDGANCFEGSAAAPTLTNTTAALRNTGGCAETDSNSADFAAASPTPRNSASPTNACAAPTSPTGTGAANPNSVLPGDPTLLTVTVTPGTNPASTGLTVTGDLSSIGGSATQAFFDDQTNGDVTAGDNIFSFQATVSAGTTPGAKSLPFAIGDAQSRSGTGSIALTVQTPAPPLVVVSQVYGGGGNSGSTFKNDFIELFNRGTTTVNVTGWSVQYTSAAGTFWQVTNLSGSIPPGRYYLVQEAQGAGGTVNLPPPDATGTIAMSATAGKVALVSSTTALTGACPTGAQISDFVGYGSSATCFEGSGPTPAPSNTNAEHRANGGCTDTNNNAGDFATGSPDPRNSATPFIDCSAPPPPTIELYIHEIQGSGSASPYAGQTVKTHLVIVTGLKSNGFYIQEPDADADSDPNTSEGVFVFTSSAPSVAIGDAVIVRGTVAEFIPSADPNSPPVTEISGSPTTTLLSSGNALPTPITLTASDTSPTGSIEQLEKYEGMRVRVNSLTVIAPTQGTVNEAAATSTTSGVFYGVITGVARPFREPGVEVPDPLPAGSPCCVARFDANPERLRVDSDAQPGAAALEVTSGAVVTNLTGPLDYSFRAYTILPDAATPPSMSGNISAIPVPLPGSDQFTVGSFNMERFFDIFNDPNKDDVALTGDAFTRRLNKASLAIRNVMRYPDILGVEEMENLTTLQAVADKVNADAVAAGDPNPNYQAYLEEGNDIGGIDVGFLVKGAPRVAVLAVTQEGKDAMYTDPNNGQPALLNDRPSLVLRATVTETGHTPFPVTVIVNHLRSLSGVDDPADGNRVRTKRRAQAEFLANLIQGKQSADPNEHIVSIGDYNAFQFSDGYVDSIGTIVGSPTPCAEVVLCSAVDLVNPNLVDLVDTAPAAERYSYSFDGNAQLLDHELITQNLQAHFDAIHYARNDADFPESYRGDATRPERISDHDMPVAYFNIPPEANLSITKGDAPDPVTTGGTLTYTLTVSNAGPDAAANVTVTDTLPSEVTFVSCSSTGSGTCGGSGNARTVSFASLANGATETITLTATVVCAVADGTTVSNTATVGSDTSDTDTSDNSSTATTQASNPAPVVTAPTVDKTTLWPANHQMVPVTVTYGVSNNCGTAICGLSVASNEPVNGSDDGDTAPDWQIVDEHHVLLRAERSGTGTGRIYTISVTCTDSAGGVTVRTVNVTVPRSQPK
jgi:uncharacterized repeat protein (TIGR01451 family)